MPLVKNENDVKKQSLFLEYEVGEAGNMLMLKSHLYQIVSHFINGVKRSVICRGDGECAYCQAGYKRRNEYNYMVFLNGQTGFIDIKASVFFAIQGISKAQKKDPRQIAWTVIKTGSGLDTEYTTSKDDNLSAEDYDTLVENLDANTDKLVEAMERREEELEKNHNIYIGDIKQQTDPKKVRETEATPQEESVSQTKKKIELDPEEEFPMDEAEAGSVSKDQEVDPNDIPF